MMISPSQISEWFSFIIKIIDVSKALKFIIDYLSTRFSAQCLLYSFTISLLIIIGLVEFLISTEYPEYMPTKPCSSWVNINLAAQVYEDESVRVPADIVAMIDEADPWVEVYLTWWRRRTLCRDATHA